MSQKQACGPCSKESNNKKWDCPSRMSDGRLYTDYRPRCDIQLELQPPMSGTLEYRQFLIHNADKVIQHHRSLAFDKAYCGPCVQPWNQGTMAPEADSFVCDKVACARVPGAAGGIGTSRNYGMLPEHKEAQDAFLADQAEIAKKRLGQVGNCCGSANNGYYPLPGLNVTAQTGPSGGVRWAVPGGGTPLTAGDPSVANM